MTESTRKRKNKNHYQIREKQVRISRKRYLTYLYRTILVVVSFVEFPLRKKKRVGLTPENQNILYASG